MPPGPVLRFGGALAWVSAVGADFAFPPFALFVPDLFAPFADGSAEACGESAAGSAAALADGSGAAAVTTGAVASTFGAGASTLGAAEATGSALGAVFSACLPPRKSATSTPSKKTPPPAA